MEILTQATSRGEPWRWITRRLYLTAREESRLKWRDRDGGLSSWMLVSASEINMAQVLVVGTNTGVFQVVHMLA